MHQDRQLRATDDDGKMEKCSWHYMPAAFHARESPGCELHKYGQLLCLPSPRRVAVGEWHENGPSIHCIHRRLQYSVDRSTALCSVLS